MDLGRGRVLVNWIEKASFWGEGLCTSPLSFIFSSSLYGAYHFARRVLPLCKYQRKLHPYTSPSFLCSNLPAVLGRVSCWVLGVEDLRARGSKDLGSQGK